MEKLRVRKERRYSAHHMFMRVARRALFTAESKQENRLEQVLISITFSALALEAYLNAAGKIMKGNDHEFEHLDFAEKAKSLCSMLTIPWARTIEPWATVVWLHNFRNKIAHAKPESIIEEKTMTAAAFDNTRHEWPKSALEKTLTLGNARRCVEQVYLAETRVRERIDPAIGGPLYGDSMSARASVHEPDGHPRSAAGAPVTPPPVGTPVTPAVGRGSS